MPVPPSKWRISIKSTEKGYAVVNILAGGIVGLSGLLVYLVASSHSGVVCDQTNGNCPSVWGTGEPLLEYLNNVTSALHREEEGSGPPLNGTTGGEATAAAAARGLRRAGVARPARGENYLEGDYGYYGEGLPLLLARSAGTRKQRLLRNDHESAWQVIGERFDVPEGLAVHHDGGQKSGGKKSVVPLSSQEAPPSSQPTNRRGRTTTRPRGLETEKNHVGAAPRALAGSYTPDFATISLGGLTLTYFLVGTVKMVAVAVWGAGGTRIGCYSTHLVSQHDVVVSFP